MNKIKGNIKVNVIDAPHYGIYKKEILDDLSLLTGATIINEDLGDDIDLIDVEQLGQCKKSISTESETILQVGSLSDEVKDLIKEVEGKIKKTKNPQLIQKYEKRLAKLAAGKVAIVKVGANSEVELQEKKDRVEDAICATKAAIKEGIVPGGGIALIKCSTKYKPKPSLGEEILLQAIRQPFKTILNNAGSRKIYVEDLQ